MHPFRRDAGRWGGGVSAHPGSPAGPADRRAPPVAAASHWHVLRIAAEIVDRARQPFPGEPIRTLDAIHLASALVARTAVAGVQLLSLDDRIRKAGGALGLEVLPP